jgi:hypothetical protein
MTRSHAAGSSPFSTSASARANRDDCLPMFSERNIHVVAGEIQKHQLLGRRHEAAFRLQPLKKVSDLDPEPLGDAIQPAGGHTVETLFVLVGLLIGHPDQLSHLLLGQAQHDAALAHPSPDVAVDILCPTSICPLLSRHRSPHRYA